MRYYSWSIEDVMEYYGEYIKDEEEGLAIMKEVGDGGFSEMMRQVRLILIERKGVDIPFTSGYRRVKKEPNIDTPHPGDDPEYLRKRAVKQNNMRKEKVRDEH